MKPTERKHLRMRIFHKTEDSRSKEQHKNRFHFISPTMKTNVNRIFFLENKISFRVSYKHSLKPCG